VTRALFKVKRKSIANIDENEDGARAILIEEGLTTWIFEAAQAHQFFANTDQLGFDLLKAVKPDLNTDREKDTSLQCVTEG
jgi:hypothetical protein